jgi:hypothetical protein
MAIKKGNQKQKQKQKQRQTVIVNINEKPKQTRRRRKATASSKPSQPSNMHMFNPSIINKPSQTNDDVKELLLKLGKAHQTNNDLISRVLAIQQVNPQNEVVIDATEEATLPNRTNSSMSSHDAEMIRLRAITAHYAPFSFSNAEEQTEDINRVQNRMVAPIIPFNAYLEQSLQQETPKLKQPKTEYQTEAGTSGTEPIGDVEYDTLPTDQERQPDAEVAKDLDEFFQYTKALGIMDPLRHQSIAPTLLEKAGYPDAQARFMAPEAQAEPAVAQAESKKVNPKAHSTLQKADFKNATEARDAIRTWNSKHSGADQISLTKKIAGLSRPKNIDELESSLASKGLDFDKIKAFDAEHSSILPPNTRSKK